MEKCLSYFEDLCIQLKEKDLGTRNLKITAMEFKVDKEAERHLAVKFHLPKTKHPFTRDRVWSNIK